MNLDLSVFKVVSYLLLCTDSDSLSLLTCCSFFSHFLNAFSAASGEHCHFVCESRGGLTLRAAVVEKAVYL